MEEEYNLINKFLMKKHINFIWNDEEKMLHISYYKNSKNIKLLKEMVDNSEFFQWWDDEYAGGDWKTITINLRP